MGLKSQRISYLRALAINTLINEAVTIFIENEEKILAGELETSLMALSKYKVQMDSIIEISIDKVYKSKEVIEKELTGYKVLNFLLKTFTSSVINWREDKVSAFDELALECIPKEYLNKNTDLYSSLLDVSCFIASLTRHLGFKFWLLLLKLINPLLSERLPPRTGFLNDPFKFIFESTKKLKFSVFKVNLLAIKLISDFTESFSL